MKKRILVCEFHQESNTFNPIPCTLDYFCSGPVPEGASAYQACRAAPLDSHGIIDAIEDAGGEAVVAVSLYAGSGGRVSDQVYEIFCGKVDEYLSERGPFDAVCVGLHGATCTEHLDDPCGVFLKHLRSRVGPDIPITASFDLHANITDRVLEAADIICGYQRYPHTDIYRTGYRAGSLCMRLVAGERLHMAAAAVPMLTPPSGYSTETMPFRAVAELGRSFVASGDLLDYTVFNVQPWLDIPEISSRVVTVAFSPEAALEKAARLAEEMWSVRDGLWPELMTIDEVISHAEDPSSRKPVILVDASDSPNGGAPGDSVAVALRLQQRGSALSAGMFVADPAAVRKAFALGVGARAMFDIGAGMTPGTPGPLHAEATVCSLHDGRVPCEAKQGRGHVAEIGKAAVLRVGNMDIMVCEKPAVSGDPQILRHFGIEPTLHDLIVVKANTSFLEPYSAFCGDICYADTPGAGSADLKHLRWEHLPERLYPFCADSSLGPGAAFLCT